MVTIQRAPAGGLDLPHEEKPEQQAQDDERIVLVGIDAFRTPDERFAALLGRLNEDAQIVRHALLADVLLVSRNTDAQL